MIASRFSKAPASPRFPARPRRGGFTLIEILVVILVIAILASLITAVIGNSLNAARAAATKATITKLHRLLEERRQAIARDDLRTETRIVRGSLPGLARNDVAKIVAFKEVMRAQLPQRIDDLSGADRQFGSPDDSPVLKKLQQLTGEDKNLNGQLDPGEDINGNNQLDTSPFLTNSPTFPPPDSVTTSSELLYVALTMGAELGSGSTPIEFSSSEAVDTDGDGLMEVVDGWGNPLRFYRWPTSLVREDPASADDTRPVELLISGGNSQLWSSDPDDPLGRFSVWLNANASHNNVLGYFNAPNVYHVPLIVSAGQDGALGLEEPFEEPLGVYARPLQDPATRIVLVDNITNRNIAIGGN